MAAKLAETRKYFEMYNTLDRTRDYLSKEQSLLKSISDGFEEAMGSKSRRGGFLEQLQSISSGLKSNLANLQSQADRKKDALEGATVDHKKVAAPSAPPPALPACLLLLLLLLPVLPVLPPAESLRACANHDGGLCECGCLSRKCKLSLLRSVLACVAHLHSEREGGIRTPATQTNTHPHP